MAAFSKLLISETRTTDVCARVGGEEFVILLPETHMAQAHLQGNRLCKRIAEMVVQVNDISLRITASLGIVSMDEGCGSLIDLVRRSDLAMYEAKSSGRNQVMVWQGQ